MRRRAEQLQGSVAPAHRVQPIAEIGDGSIVGVQQAALRETKEETGLDVALEGHLGTYSYPDSFHGGSIVVVVYRAKILGGKLQAADDCSDAKMITAAEIPWDKLAFKSSISAIQDWLKHKGLPK